MEKYFTDGKVIIKGKTAKRGTWKKADYLLHHHNNFPIAIIEAKDGDHSVFDGMQQAIDYAKILDIPFAYSSNGEGFVEHDMMTGMERNVSIDNFPTQEELWKRYSEKNSITKQIENIITEPYYYSDNSKAPRYYQRIAINKAVDAIAKDKKRLLLVMATGTGKTLKRRCFIYYK